MKKIITLVFVALFISINHTGYQNITSSWVNREAMVDKPYKSIFVVALVPNKATRIAIEEKMAQLIQGHEAKAIKSSDWFPSKYTADAELTQEEQIKIMKNTGCDAILTITELDVKTEKRYVRETTPAPLPEKIQRPFQNGYRY